MFRLVLPTVAIGYAAITHGGDQPLEWSVCGLILGLAGVLGWVWPLGAQPSSLLDRVVLWAALFFPAYVVFQLVPLPLFLVRILSPTRAEIADALMRVMQSGSRVPISISPQATWVHLSRITGYALVFLLARESVRSLTSRWASTLPLVGIGGLETALGLIQHANEAQAISGTYYNKDHFAGLLEMILPFSLMYGITLVHRGLEKRIFKIHSLASRKLIPKTNLTTDDTDKADERQFLQPFFSNALKRLTHSFFSLFRSALSVFISGVFLQNKKSLDQIHPGKKNNKRDLNCTNYGLKSNLMTTLDSSAAGSRAGQTTWQA